jgi:MFS family permease
MRMEERRSLLKDRDFRLVAGSVGLSALGDWVAIIALGLQIQGRTESGVVVALLWICLFGPSVLVAGHAGLLVDRFETSRLLAAIALAGLVVSVVLAFAGPVWLILALTVLLGVVFAIAQPAEFALVPLLSGEDRVQEANGHVETFRYLGFAIGPLLGGFIVSTAGADVAMLVNGGTFAAVALAALSLRVRRHAATAADAEPRARDGVRFLFRDRLLGLAMTVAFVSLLFMSAVWVADLFFIRETLEMSGTAYGLFATTWTVGMMIGAMVLSRRVAAAAIASVGFAAVAVQGAALAVPTLWLSFAFLLACSVVGGLAHGVKNVMFRTMIHVRVPERLHGRAFAAYNGIRNGAELGAFAAGGFLVTAIGARGTMAFAGGFSALAGLIGLMALLRMNRGWRTTGPVGPPIEISASAPAAPEVATLGPESKPS